MERATVTTGPRGEEPGTGRVGASTVSPLGSGRLPGEGRLPCDLKGEWESNYMEPTGVGREGEYCMQAFTVPARWKPVKCELETQLRAGPQTWGRRRCQAVVPGFSALRGCGRLPLGCCKGLPESLALLGLPRALCVSVRGLSGCSQSVAA